MDKVKKSFNLRVFISTGMFTAMLCLPISGIMNHELQFEPLTVTRHAWMSVHNMTAFLFSLFTILHLTFNWRPLFRQVQTLWSRRPSKESLAAVAVVVMIVGIFSLHALHVR